MRSRTFIKGNSYNYNLIEQTAENRHYEMEEYGDEIFLGRHFISLTNGDNVVSFVLTSGGINGYIYECIYSEKLLL